MTGPAAVIVLAAGSGTRMRSKTMKVLHPLGGRTMVGHVLAAATSIGARRLVAVVGHGRDQVGPHILDLVPDALLAVQESQDGTGHAVRVAMETYQASLGGTPVSGTVLVMAGDTPLLEAATLTRLVADHEATGRAVTVLTAEVAEPFGYGRILRGPDGAVLAIVEEKDATDEQRAVREINSSIYAFDATFLLDALGRITNDNAKGEYYLTDVVALANSDGLAVGGHLVDDVLQTEGANDRAQLADLAARLNARTLGRWMREGVSVVDPEATWVDVTVTLAPDVTLLPGVQLLGATVVAEDAVIGPDCTLKDVEVGNGAKVVRTHAELAVIGAHAGVGPYVHLRPGAQVGEGQRVGAFTELRASSEGSHPAGPDASGLVPERQSHQRQGKDSHG